MEDPLYLIYVTSLFWIRRHFRLLSNLTNHYIYENMVFIRYNVHTYTFYKSEHLNQQVFIFDVFTQNLSQYK
jgi:hypothetical protein